MRLSPVGYGGTSWSVLARKAAKKRARTSSLPLRLSDSRRVERVTTHAGILFFRIVKILRKTVTGAREGRLGNLLSVPVFL